MSGGFISAQVSKNRRDKAEYYAIFLLHIFEINGL